MGLFSRYLLSTAVSLAILQLSARAQTMHCDDVSLRDSLAANVFRNHSYTTQAYQAACDSLLSLCPGWDNVYQMKAMPFIKKGRAAEAYFWLDKAVALNPAEHLDYRAFLKCIFTKDYAGALDDFIEAEKLRPGGGLMDHSYRFYIALCHIGLGNISTARSMLDEIAKEQETRFKNAHFNTYFYQGLAHYLAGDGVVRAEQAFSRCLAIHPHHPDAHFYMGRVLLAQEGRKEKALSHFQECISAIKEGYTNSEDQEPYVRYPYEVGVRDAEEQLGIKQR
jgi:tetratricopeptide (TPR) repeat protein